jgi:adenosylcobinamide-phosphate synthase
MISLDWHILPLAFLLDLVLGDPLNLPHPIRWMGNAISILEPFFRKIRLPLAVSGAAFTGVLVIGAFMLTHLIIVSAQFLHPVLRAVMEVIIIYYAVSVRSLVQAATAVYHALKNADLPDARKKVSFIIGRDTGSLDAAGVTGGAVESVAENLVDGVISPLFFACIGGAPLAMAYKMINTLDSMIGYKNEKYERFGKFAARLDDAANYLPARLSVPVISVAAQVYLRNGMSAFKTAALEGANHTSPNAGYPEAAFAGALNVKLNGPNFYGGRLVDKPFIGIRFDRPDLLHIKKACNLMMLSASIWLLVVWALNILIILFLR